MLLSPTKSGLDYLHLRGLGCSRCDTIGENYQREFLWVARGCQASQREGLTSREVRRTSGEVWENLWRTSGLLSSSSERTSGDRRQKMTSTGTERQKRSQNLAPVLVILSGNSLVFSRKIITSTGFCLCCAAGASAPVVVKYQSPRGSRPGKFGELLGKPGDFPEARGSLTPSQRFCQIGLQKKTCHQQPLGTSLS